MSENNHEIIFHNRQTGKLEKENVYGGSFVKLLYANKAGLKLERILAQKWVSSLYGHFQSSSLSKHKIEKFIADYAINMDEFEGRGKYQSFNDFFVRTFRPGARPFVPEQNVLPAFAEARYLGFEAITSEQVFPVKGNELSAEVLLAHQELAQDFMGGPLLIARLCPVDYHRFHFPDDGELLKFYEVSGALHSVNPLALKSVSGIFCGNERHVSILQTKNFGKIAYIEVGAMCVGKIVQTHPAFSGKNKSFKRGEEKGMFLFGGSTVVVLGEKGKWSVSPDILENTSNRREVYVKLGEELGGVKK